MADSILRQVGSPFKKTLDKINSGERAPAKLSCQALADAVVACASDESALDSLDDLLKTGQVAVNYEVDLKADADMQGTPLYLAAKLDLPKAAEILLAHGASMVHAFDGETPLAIAMRLKHADVLAVFFERVKELEDESPTKKVAQPNFDAASTSSKKAARGSAASSSKKRGREANA